MFPNRLITWQTKPSCITLKHSSNPSKTLQDSHSPKLSTCSSRILKHFETHQRILSNLSHCFQNPLMTYKELSFHLHEVAHVDLNSVPLHSRSNLVFRQLQSYNQLNGSGDLWRLPEKSTDYFPALKPSRY